MVSLSKLNGFYLELSIIDIFEINIWGVSGFRNIFGLFSEYFRVIFGLFILGFGNNVGISWEKLGTFISDNQSFKIFLGNIVGISWEYRGKKYWIFGRNKGEIWKKRSR
jgi:hypothetical protein